MSGAEAVVLVNKADTAPEEDMKRARKRGGQPRSCSITQRKMVE